jgi:RNA polymerase sigma-70 factor (ECF subfamily)
VDGARTGRPTREDTLPEGDRALVAALVARDETAFARLLDLWGPAMLRVARSHVSTDASAEEVVQDAWLAVLRGIDRFEGRSTLRTWVFRIVSNTAKTRGVRERRTVPMSSLRRDDESDAPTVDPDRFRPAGDQYPGHWRSFPVPWPSPEQRAVGAEVGRVVADALAGLPDQQRTVVTLRDVHGFDAHEVCRLLDVSDGNQRVLLHRGRAALRLRLETFFGADARWGATP